MLWAMSRLLRVLDPSSGLSSVLMESLSPLDEVSKYPDMLLAADMTEYFGGDSFDTAESVVVSQLKYSQRHPNKEWTAARLSASNSRGRPGIVERLADIFKIHLEEHGRDATLKKLRLRVVSNQPASPDLIAALRKAQAVLDGKPRQVLFKTLTARLNKREEADLRRMLNASKLSQRSFSDLIRLLAIDDLGAGSRALQERQIVAALGQHVLSDVNNSMNGLYRRVQREALPEGLAPQASRRPTYSLNLARRAMTCFRFLRGTATPRSRSPRTMFVSWPGESLPAKSTSLPTALPALARQRRWVSWSRTYRPVRP